MAAFALALISLVLALGVFSSLTFAWQWVIGPVTPRSALILLIAVLATFLKVFVYIRRRLPDPPVQSGRRWILPLTFTAALSYAGYWVYNDAAKIPHGGWDAWAVWNLHARFLYRGSDGPWQYMFGPEMTWTQNDYPMLIPGLVSGMWMIAGEWPLIPAVLGIAFAALTLGILCSAVSALGRDERGWPAGLILLATPTYLLTSTAQTADVPIGLYILTTIVLLRFADVWQSVKTSLLTLSGLSAGLAAWTKQEGLLFVVALLGSLVAVFAFRRKWRALLDSLLPFTLGLASMLVLIFSFKVFLAPASNVVSAEVVEQTLEKPPALDQVIPVVRGFWDVAKGFGGTWGTGGIHPSLLAVLFLLLYPTSLRTISPSSLSLILLMALMLAGYFIIYVITPGGAEGFLGNTLPRLILQMWPSWVFIITTLSLSKDFSDAARHRAPSLVH